jgi:Uma2 family endonuclease
MIQRSTQTRQYGPADHGRRLSYDEFMAANYELGSYYELADGRLCVYPFPELGHAMVADWPQCLLLTYAEAHKDVVNFCTSKGYVIVPNRKRDTALRPDVAAYQNVPRFGRNLAWRDMSPFLVAEVTAPEHAEKDVGRNVRFYSQVPTIVEYWLVDARESLDYPTLRIHQRNGKKWKVVEVAPKEPYTTPLLPNFKLLNDHRAYYRQRWAPKKRRGTSTPRKQDQ